MELLIFARFHASEGNEDEVEAAIREVAVPTIAEPGCVIYCGCRSIRDPRLFTIHSRWADEAAFELHAELPHTAQFLERVDRLVDQPVEVIRAEQFV